MQPEFYWNNYSVEFHKKCQNHAKIDTFFFFWSFPHNSLVESLNKIGQGCLYFFFFVTQFSMKMVALPSNLDFAQYQSFPSFWHSFLDDSQRPKKGNNFSIFLSCKVLPGHGWAKTAFLSMKNRQMLKTEIFSLAQNWGCDIASAARGSEQGGSDPYLSFWVRIQFSMVLTPKGVCVCKII